MLEPRRNGSTRRWRMGGAMCVILVLFAGCANSRPVPPPQLPDSGPYQIGPDDVLEIMVWKEDTISGPVQVRPDGMITVPLIGDLQASGKAPEALAEEIREGLTRFIDNPNVVVRVAATGSRRFFIVGNVRSPGAYDLRANQTFLQALAVAGGFTEFASRGSVRIMRQAGEEGSLHVNYDEVLSGKTPDIRLEPNDTIIVP